MPHMTIACPDCPASLSLDVPANTVASLEHGSRREHRLNQRPRVMPLDTTRLTPREDIIDPVRPGTIQEIDLNRGD